MSNCESTIDELAEARERVRRLEAVVEAGLMVNSTLDLAELAEHVVCIATRLIHAERGSLFLVDRETGRLRSMVAQGLTTGPLTVEVGEGIVGAVAASGDAEILDDPYLDSRFDPKVDQLTGFQTRSLLTVPVRDREGLMIAVLQLLNHRDGNFSVADVEFLAELGVPFAIALTTADLHREIVAREQLRREVRLAAEIQRALQPEGRADIPGLEIEVLFEPCHEVGGDYWDVIPVGNDRWWIVVADVSGKGVPAGLVASNIQACLWSRRTASEPLTSIVADINEILCRLTRGRKYATLVAAEWNSANETLTWVSAGHPPLMLRRNRSVHDYGATGRPIGLLRDQSFESEKASLAKGDTVLLYTDGLLEAGGIGGSNEFGLDRIRACFDVDGSPRDVIERLTVALADHIDGGEPEDDVTLVCLRRKGAEN
ncbi:MAG: SpoIIE family protein phosphatase [Acidobacteria bacterium]|uniref:SpoIIE family protein phosphatase n=1 Tax=Candidatus Sulfomarinibacter kjeldsenii TaxID=2885994 RepID=A0A8J6YBW8_9BACT|nr:SpoIIE family protein phosphatase [Candidatus Sulfomarinibacter kjeldsenii]